MGFLSFEPVFLRFVKHADTAVERRQTVASVLESGVWRGGRPALPSQQHH